jgi:hypothetical protein
MAVFVDTAGLQSAVTQLANRETDTDFLAYLPTAIELVEARLRRLLRSKNVTRSTTVTILAGTSSIALPAGIKELRSVAGANGPLRIASATGLSREAVNLQTSGTPSIASLVNDVLYVAPVAAVNTSLVLTYEPEVTPLAAGANWVLLNHPDLYQYGTLVEMSPFIRDDPRVPLFEARFQTAISELELVRDRTEYPNTPVMRPRTLG